MAKRALMLMVLAVLYAGEQSTQAQAADGGRVTPRLHPTTAKERMQQSEKKVLLELETFRSRHDVEALYRALGEMLRIENVIAPVSQRAPVKDKFALWLNIFDAIDSEQVPDIDTTSLTMNVVPPLETGLPSGVSPAAIKDPAQRAEYEAAIAANDELNKRVGYQHDLRTWEQFAEDSLLDLVEVASQSQLEGLRSRVAQSPLQAQRKIRLTELLTPAR